MDLSKSIGTNDEYVCVKLSGGADSAIIYYAVCNTVKDTNTKIIVITLDTDFKDQYIAGAKRVIKIVKELTGVEPYEHITNTVEHSLENYDNGQHHLLEKVWEKYGKNIPVYSGLTINPPYEEMVDFFKNNADRLGIDFEQALGHINSRDTSRDNKLPYGENPGRLFGKTDKRGTAAAYKHYNMMEKLYPYTFSCESAPYEIGSDNMPIHCGHCFFCLERWWGFDRLP